MSSTSRPPAAFGIEHDLGIVTATDGYVIVEGPGSTALTLTPDAADTVAAALVAAARDAREQDPAEG